MVTQASIELTVHPFWLGNKGMESGQDQGASWEVLRSSCKVQPSPGDCPLHSERGPAGSLEATGPAEATPLEHPKGNIEAWALGSDPQCHGVWPWVPFACVGGEPGCAPPHPRPPSPPYPRPPIPPHPKLQPFSLGSRSGQVCGGDGRSRKERSPRAQVGTLVLSGHRSLEKVHAPKSWQKIHVDNPFQQKGNIGGKNL